MRKQKPALSPRTRRWQLTQHVPAIAPRTDADSQDAHSDNTAFQNAPAQPASDAATNTPATDTNVIASNAATASAPSQPAAVQANATVLQVGPQEHGAGAQPDLAAIAVNIAARSKDGEKHFDIRLDPPDLGRIDAWLSVDNSGKAQAHLTADKPQTLDFLQHDRTVLERSLKDVGLDLSNNGLNFSLKGQDRQGDKTPAPIGGSTLAVTAVESDEAASNTATNIDGLRAGCSHVAIRV